MNPDKIKIENSTQVTTNDDILLRDRNMLFNEKKKKKGDIF